MVIFKYWQVGLTGYFVRISPELLIKKEREMYNFRIVNCPISNE